MSNLRYRAVKDSGTREEFPTGSRRDTREGKGRFDLIPTIALRRLAIHYENGAEKYGDNNWQKGQPLSRYKDSTLRHICDWSDGDQSEDHLAAAIWNLVGILWTEIEGLEGRLPGALLDTGPYEMKEEKDAATGAIPSTSRQEPTVTLPDFSRDHFRVFKCLDPTCYCQDSEDYADPLPKPRVDVP